MNRFHLRILSTCLVTLLGLTLSACGWNDDPATVASTATAGSTSSAGSSNRVPSISGIPLTTASVGASYSFTPVATDEDGNTLAFSISNKPAWASFNTSTGTLTGIPTAAGTFANIVISVSDGTATASLVAFTVSVTSTGSATLSWTAPTHNTDGTPLTDLAGYTVHYGTSASNLSNSVTVNSPSTTTYTITSLVTGRTYYFAIASVNSSGVSSDLSGVASKTI